MSRIRLEIADLEWRMERYRAEAVTCTGCGARGRDQAPAAQHCRNPHTGDELNAPAHHMRIADALRKETGQ